MESPGEHLKRERELRGITLRKVFEVTRVPFKFLEAVEADDYDSLPHPTFVKGYLRAYCKFLGIDENDSILRYELFVREKSGMAYDIAPLPEVGDKGVPSLVPLDKKWIIPALVGGGIIILIILVSVIYKQRPAGKIQDKAETKVESTASGVKSPLNAVATPVPLIPDKAVLAQVKIPEKPALIKPPSAAAPRHEQTVAGKQSATAEPSQLRHSLYMKANENVWVKVRIDDAPEPLDVLLRPGEAVTWKAENAFSLIIGNAGGVEVSLDGAPLGILGKSGEVVSLKLPRSGAPPSAVEEKAGDAGIKAPPPAQEAPPVKPQTKP